MKNLIVVIKPFQHVFNNSTATTVGKNLISVVNTPLFMESKELSVKWRKSKTLNSRPVAGVESQKSHRKKLNHWKQANPEKNEKGTEKPHWKPTKRLTEKMWTADKCGKNLVVIHTPTYTVIHA